MRSYVVNAVDAGSVADPVAPRGPGSAAGPVFGTGSFPDVVVLRWPEDVEALERLRAAGLPRLLLVGPNVDPPEGGDCEQDWVRLPADDRDVGARLRALSQRARRHQATPELDPFGRLMHRGRWVALSPTEEALMRLLLERFGAVVTYEALRHAAWPDEAASSNALRVHLTRLRRRLAPLGLDLRSVRTCGVVIEELAPSGT